MPPLSSRPSQRSPESSSVNTAFFPGISARELAALSQKNGFVGFSFTLQTDFLKAFSYLRSLAREFKGALSEPSIRAMSSGSDTSCFLIASIDTVKTLRSRGIVGVEHKLSPVVEALYSLGWDTPDFPNKKPTKAQLNRPARSVVFLGHVGEVDNKRDGEIHGAEAFLLAGLRPHWRITGIDLKSLPPQSYFTHEQADFASGLRRQPLASVDTIISALSLGYYNKMGIQHVSETFSSSEDPKQIGFIDAHRFPEVVAYTQEVILAAHNALKTKGSFHIFSATSAALVIKTALSDEEIRRKFSIHVTLQAKGGFQTFWTNFFSQEGEGPTFRFELIKQGSAKK